jgi:hypothetical protein
MRVQYLVTAYKEPLQIRRLCEHLGPHVTVQWDRTTPLPSFGAVSGRATRCPVVWGDGTFLNALLDSFLLLRRNEFDWLVVLSGQDYPIRPITELETALAHDDYALYMETPHVAGYADIERGYLDDRYFYQYRWIPDRVWRPLPRQLQRATGGLLKFAVNLWGERSVRVQRRPANLAPGFAMRARHHPFTPNLPCRKGSDWFALSRPVFDRLNQLVQQRPDLVHYFSRTYIPTESFFHTILFPEWEDRNAGTNLHYRVMAGDGARPKLLDENDLDAMIASGKYFARKFARDSPVLDALDRQL